MGIPSARGGAPKEDPAILIRCTQMTRLFNIRLGHACNSSSTHSIVPLAALLERRGVNVVSDAATMDHGYGWQRFTLASAEEKMAYLSLQMRENNLSEELREAVTGIPSDQLKDGYVDHQSRLSLPTGRHQEEFLHDLADYMRGESVIVLGGDDNGSDPELFSQLPWHRMEGLLARPDVGEIAIDGRRAQSRYWTLIERGSGNKIRFSFDAQPLCGEDVPEQDISLRYSSAPELIDLKITQFCPFSRDCPMCYMASDGDGGHGDVNEIFAYLGQMADAGVFEVALGGGEPTLHPFFTWILEHGHRRGLAMNFTTKNFALFSQEKFDDVRRFASAVAISVNNRRDFERFRQLVEAGRDDGRGWIHSSLYGGGDDTLHVTLQCIPAMLSRSLLTDILAYSAEYDIRLTLLGFKRTGRGIQMEVNPNHRWVDVLADLIRDDNHWNRYHLEHAVAIDTLMAAECEPLFADAGISPVWYGTQEGAFSCYIDAVTNQLGDSSYVPERDMLPFPAGADLVQTYQRMQVERGIR